MKIETIVQFLTINLVIYISLLSPALAQNSTANSSKNFNSKSQIIPYILENPNTGNSRIRIRCISTKRQASREAHRRIIRDTLLRPETQNTVIIEIEGDCHPVTVPEYEQFDNFAPDDYWLIRPGSGWDWKLRR